MPRFMARFMAAQLGCLFSLLLTTQGAFAQISQCALLTSLTEIEHSTDQLLSAAALPETAATSTLSAQLSAQISRLAAQQQVIYVAEQLIERPDWVAAFLSSRGAIATLYINKEFDTLRAAAMADDYVALRAEREIILKLVPCIAGETDWSGPESLRVAGQQSAGETPEYADAPSGEMSGLARFLASLSSFLAQNLPAIAPYLYFVAVFALVWALMKIDDHRAQCRQRFICHVEVEIIGPHFTQNGHIADISRVGALLHNANPISIESNLLIKSGDWQRKARVTRVGDGVIGVAFKPKLTKIPPEFIATGKKKWLPKSEYN